MKVTLIGRPGRVVEKQDLVITMMPPMDAPKGVPTPPTTPTVSSVSIAKQWKNVAQAIRNPEDRLIVEEAAACVPGLEGIVGFVTNTSAKLLQEQTRQAPGTEARG